MSAMIDLDAWLPDPEIVTRHQRAAAVAPDALWAAARSVRLDQTRTIGRLVRWRIPGVPPDQSFMGLLASDPFTVLDEGPDYSISGLVRADLDVRARLRRPLRPRRLPGLAGAAHRARAVRALGDAPRPDGRSTLVSEARIGPTDKLATVRVRALWIAVGPFERLIGAEALALAAARAESAGRP